MRTKQARRLDPNTIVLIKHIAVGFFVLGVAGLLFAGVWYGSRIQALTITEVEIEGGETIDHQVMREIALQSLSGTYLGVVPKRFAWFYPQAEIIAAVERIDRVHEVRVVRKNGSTLFITFDEYVPTALWCESISSESCLFLDKDGYAFAPAPKLTGGRFLRFVTIDRPPATREHIVDKLSITETVRLVDLFEANDWFISHVEVGQDNDLFLHVVGGGELKVNLEQSSEETVGNLLTILTAKEFEHITPGNFQYIDLRFGKKAFVNEELAVPPEEETASGTASSSDADFQEPIF